MAQQILLKRLKGKLRIAHLFEKGKVYHSQNILLKILENNHDDALYAAVSVSKRNFIRAVDRNRIKRQLREALRLSSQGIPMKGSAMLIFKGKTLPQTAILIEEVNALLQGLNGNATTGV